MKQLQRAILELHDSLLHGDPAGRIGVRAGTDGSFGITSSEEPPLQISTVSGTLPRQSKH